MTTTNWPSNVGFTSIGLTARNVVAVSESPFTLQRTVYEFSGERWELEASIVSLRGDDAESLMCTILKIRQMAEPVCIPIDLFGFELKGAATGSILVDGAAQTGRSIDLKGAAHEQVIFKQGDFINIGTRLYKILEDATSDSSGELTASIWPAILTAPADETAIVFSAPTITVELENLTGFSFSSDKIMTASLKAVEVV